MRKHYVRYFSPGTFLSEESERPIYAWDVELAAQGARKVNERYGAKPYAFVFLAKLVGDPVPDGEGGVLQVEPKEVMRSGYYYLKGKLLTIEDIKARRNPTESILLSNMQANGWPIVVETCNSYRSIQPFEERDFVIDAEGRILERGDDPRHVAYRERKIAERKAWLAEQAAKGSRCQSGHEPAIGDELRIPRL